MPYTATNDYNDLDAALPVGSDSPDVLDDVDRETRLVGKTVMMASHTGKGQHRKAIWKQVVTAAVPSGAINQWNRRALATLSDPTGLLSAGDYVNSIKPVAGLYQVRFWAFGYKCDNFMARLALATGDTLAPSAATEIATLLGNYALSNNADNSSGLSSGGDTLQTDGTKSYCLDQRQSVANNTDGWGRAAAAGWTTTTTGTNVVAFVEFELLTATP